MSGTGEDGQTASSLCSAVVMMPSQAEEEEEKALLASVGTTRAETGAYESSVVKAATLSTAPRLSPTTMEGGFPKLETLAPRVELPHMMTVLSRIRQSLHTLNTQQPSGGDSNDDGNSHEARLLRMKEQILLSYLTHVARVPKEDLHLEKEAERERNRSAAIWRGRTQTRTTARSATAFTQNADSTGDYSLRNDSNLSVTERLNGIKKGGGLDGSPISHNKSRTRVSMMGMKRKLRDQEGGVSWDDMQEDAAKRRKKRQDRISKRKARMERKQMSALQHDDDSSEEAELDDATISKIQPIRLATATIDNSSKTIPEKASVSDDIENEAHSPTEVRCPICQTQFNVPAGSEQVDTFLSRHMDRCQRLSRRSRSRADKVVDDLDDTNVNDEPDQTYEAETSMSNAPRTRASTTRRRSSSSIKTKTSAIVEEHDAKPAIDDIEEWQYEDRVDEWVETGVDKMSVMAEQDSNEVPPGCAMYSGGLEIPAWINNRLFPYQRTGLRWMWELHTQDAGGIVADDMGTGKTVQLAAFLGAMAGSRKLKSVLVIAPATMLSHWLMELKKWAPGLRRVLIHKSGENDGTSRSVSIRLLNGLDKWLKRARADRLYEPIDEQDLVDYDPDTFCGTGYVVVTTYESIRRNDDIWTRHTWSYVVMDEGQKIRNPDADITLACKRLRTPHRLLLSGTPIQNDLKELWSLVDFTFPGRLGTLPAFETEFADPIKRGGYSNASPMQVQLAYRCALVLRDLINPYLLRRQKKDLKEVSRLPGKTEQVLFCRLSNRQRSMYEAYLRSEEVANLMKGSTQLFRSIITLRKICNHPDLVCKPGQSSYESFLRNGHVNDDDLESSSDEDEMSMNERENLVECAGKFEVLAKILPLWHNQGHRVLIFCQWKKMLNIIESFTRQQGWKFGRMDGNTNIGSRQKLVDTFNTDLSYFGMLMTTKTGGVGLNLTGADRIVLYDPDWNPQTDAQARERAWRFGQKKPVTVYRLITAGTIEEKIYHRQIFKTAVTNQVLQDPKQRRLFSQKDLRDLFTLKADTGSISKGGDGFTETGQITKGGGVYNVDDDKDSSSDHPDNGNTLEAVMKSRGLAGVFDHDFIDKPNATKKSRTVQEMEDQAKRVAQKAVRALRESTTEQDSFTPTWTGSAATETGRFGVVSTNAAPAAAGGRFGRPKSTIMHADESFGGAKSAGLSSQSGSSMSSGALLAQIKKRNDLIGSGGRRDPAGAASEETMKYVTVLKQLRDYINSKGGRVPGRGPETDALLKQFENISSCDAATFRRLLNSVAKLQNGKWHLK